MFIFNIQQLTSCFYFLFFLKKSIAKITKNFLWFGNKFNYFFFDAESRRQKARISYSVTQLFSYSVIQLLSY